MTDSELHNYAKSTFLGTGKPAEGFKERQIIRNNSVGEIIQTKIPKFSNIEIHLITLSDNTKFVLAFKSVNSIEAGVLEKTILNMYSIIITGDRRLLNRKTNGMSLIILQHKVINHFSFLFGFA